MMMNHMSISSASNKGVFSATVNDDDDTVTMSKVSILMQRDQIIEESRPYFAIRRHHY